MDREDVLYFAPEIRHLLKEPPMSAADVVATEQQYLLQTYARPAFVLERGEGCYLYDTDGNRYLDFVAGIAVNALGYNDPDVAQAIADNAHSLIHVSNLYHTRQQAELAKLLVESSFADRAFFSNSGAEAIEGALKMARKVAYERGEYDRHEIVAFSGSFHGRTMGAVAVTSREKYRTPYEPVMPGARFAPYNDIGALDEIITERTCAVIVEPIQGEGGLSMATPEFLRALRARCDATGALLIFDEIQCGMGRTGMLWAHEHTGVTPDIMTVAKPLGGGLPIGAVLMTQHVADAIHAGDHGTTFGGGPFVTAIAQTVFRKIANPEFLAHVREVGDYLDESLQDLAAQHPHIAELRGRGLMRGIRLHGAAGPVRAAAEREGLLLVTAGDDVLRLVPPLILGHAEVDAAIAALGRALATA